MLFRYLSNPIITLLIILLLVACSSEEDEQEPRLDYTPTCDEFAQNEICKVFYFPDESGEKREYILHLPDGDIEASPPLLIFLHGGGGSARNSPIFFGTRTFLDDKKYIGVIPNARFNDAGFRSWDFDDVEFIDEIIRQQVIESNIDLDRVFVFGFSNGGFLANYLACKIPNRITAIISHAGALLAPLDDPINNCVSNGDVAIHHIHATGDEIIPFDGAEERFLSANAAITEWSVFNQCDDSFSESTPFDLTFDMEGNDASTRTYQNCIKPVQLTVIEGSIHLSDFRFAPLFSLMEDFYDSSLE